VDTLTWTILAGVIGACGWVYKLYRDDRKDRRKEMRSRVDTLIEMVEEVESAANTYYQIPPTDSRCFDLANIIRVKCKQIGNRAFNIQIDLPPTSLTSLLIRFRKAASGGDFDQVSRIAVTTDSPILRELADASRLFVDESEKLFRQKFP
jgi:hypothetical protein